MELPPPEGLPAASESARAGRERRAWREEFEIGGTVAMRNLRLAHLPWGALGHQHVEYRTL
jgi:hypothetical protein